MDASAAPLGLSWYALEEWASGKTLRDSIRDSTSDTVLSCSLTPEVRERHGLFVADAESLVSLPDAAFSALCTELDVSANGRVAQTSALLAPVLSTADVHRYIILPRCQACGRRAIVESLEGLTVTESLWNTRVPAVRTATVFVSHVWSCNFDDLLSALDEFMCTVPLEQRHDVYFWLDVFCVNPFEAATRNYAGWASTFGHMIGSIGHTLAVCLPALTPLALQRSWCILQRWNTRPDAPHHASHLCAPITEWPTRSDGPTGASMRSTRPSKMHGHA